MPIYFHSCLCSYLSRVPILVEDTVLYIYFSNLLTYSTVQKFGLGKIFEINLLCSSRLHLFDLKTVIF